MKKLNILLVLDQADKVASYEAILKVLGHNLTFTNLGGESLLERDFDLILLDLSSPENDCCTTTELIRTNPKLKQPPIILITDPGNLDAKKLYKFTQIDVVSTPIIPEILRGKVSLLAELLETRRELGDLRSTESSREFAGSNNALPQPSNADDFRNWVEVFPEAIFIQQKQKIVYANAKSLRLLNASSASVADKSLNNIFQSAESTEKVLEDEKNLARSHVAVVFSDGETNEKMAFELTFCGVRYGGHPAVMALAHDVTEQKKLEEEKRQERQLETIEKFAGKVAHEIRNPLGAASLNLQLLITCSGLAGTELKRLQDSQKAVNRIDKIMKNILDFARPANPYLTRVDLRHVLESSLALVQKDLEQSSISIVRNYNNFKNATFIDIGQITQAFVNLFLNSKKAMPSGGTLIIHTHTENDDYLEVQIEDNGRGMPPDEIEHLFEPLAKRKGSGFELAIVGIFLHQNKVEVEVESKVDAGTKFILRFPSAGILEPEDPGRKYKHEGK